ncbi:hypothetical protein Golomagni_02680 [Golovinomyces magnicellulatus]|nr:hypothetical protein Golomagni_02680 [Golovinomyces magnicellulatus]
MYYSVALSAILGCIAAVKAQTPGFNPFITPKKDQDIKAGEKFNITWEPAGAPPDATVTIKLLQGATPATLQPGPNVASKIPSKTGCFTWAVPRSIKDAETYGLIMYLDGKEDDDNPKIIYAPKPSSVKPPPSKPSAPVGDKDKGKPPPINVSGASSLVLNLSTLIIGIFIAFAFI